MRIRIAEIILISVFFILPFFSVEGISLKVVPSSMEIKMIAGTTENIVFEIENTSRDVNLYEIYIDNFSEIATLRPQSFILEGSQKKQVIVEIKIPKEGIFSTDISVVAKPLSGRQFKAGAGIKIPLTIRVEAPKVNSFLAAVSQNFIKLIAKNSILIILMMIFAAFFLGLNFKKYRRHQ